jgi:hypothetical protein
MALGPEIAEYVRRGLKPVSLTRARDKAKEKDRKRKPRREPR